MSHLSSPPKKLKGEHKGHGLPRGSERCVGLGEGVSSGWKAGWTMGGGGHGYRWGQALTCVTHLPTPGVAPPGTRTGVLRSIVQCPCLRAGREVVPAVPHPYPRKPPTA